MENSLFNKNSDVNMSTQNSEEESEISIKRKNLYTELTNFLRAHTVYETIPENMKILVFNIELSIKDAIEAMLKEDIYCGLIWDTELNKFIGIFTIRDFLNLIKVLYEKINNFLQNDGKWTNIKNLVANLFQNNKIDLDQLDAIMEDDPDSKKNSETKSEKSENGDMIIDEIESNNHYNNNYAKNTIEANFKTYKEFFRICELININDYFTDIHPDHCLNFNLISISLDGNLKECIDLMKNNKIHRVIVEDSKVATFTGFITYETIFEYFISNYYSDMISFHVKLNNLNITTTKMIFASKDETIYNCLIKFSNHKISVLPILDGSEYFGFFYLKDIIYFFANGEKFTFNDPVSKFLYEIYEEIDNELPLGKDRMIICDNYDIDFKEALEKMFISPERKILFKTHKRENDGLVTLSDIFNILNLNFA